MAERHITEVLALRERTPAFVSVTQAATVTGFSRASGPTGRKEPDRDSHIDKCRLDRKMRSGTDRTRRSVLDMNPGMHRNIAPAARSHDPVDSGRARAKAAKNIPRVPHSALRNAVAWKYVTHYTADRARLPQGDVWSSPPGNGFTSVSVRPSHGSGQIANPQQDQPAVATRLQGQQVASWDSSVAKSSDADPVRVRLAHHPAHVDTHRRRMSARTSNPHPLRAERAAS